MKDERESGAFAAEEALKKVSLWTLFALFAKIGAFTLGGGYAMVPIIDREIVKKRGWMSEEEFLDVLAIAQSAPGLLAVNISIFAGYRVRKNIGSVIATLGSCLPSFVIILLIAMFFANFRENPYVEKIFKGIRPVVVALIAVPVADMVKRSGLNLFRTSLAAATAVAVVFLRISPIYILLVTAAVFFAGRYFGERRTVRKSDGDKDVKDNDKEKGGGR